MDNTEHRLYGADPTNRDGLQNALPVTQPDDARTDENGDPIFAVDGVVNDDD